MEERTNQQGTHSCCAQSEGLLTGRDGDVRAVPELLRVRVSVTAERDSLVDPVFLVRCAFGWPRWGVELGVSLVLARVSGVCSVVKKQEKGQGVGNRATGQREKIRSRTFKCAAQHAVWTSTYVAKTRANDVVVSDTSTAVPKENYVAMVRKQDKSKSTHSKPSARCSGRT